MEAYGVEGPFRVFGVAVGLMKLSERIGMAEIYLGVSLLGK